MPGIKDAKCVLVIGATAGLGRALALSILNLESQPIVIAVGRRQERLDELSKQSSRIKAMRANINASEEELKNFVQNVLSKYPQLDVIVFMSGVQHVFDFTNPESIDLRLFDEELNTNYVSLAKLIILFLPHFLKLSNDGRPSFLIPVTSGLAIVPKPSVFGYCATKAAVHSFTLSLRAYLADTKINVIEILPPLVESELHDHQGMTPTLSKFWMPLEKFTGLVMEGLIRGDQEVAVGDAATAVHKYDQDKRAAVTKMHNGNGILGGNK